VQRHEIDQVNVIPPLRQPYGVSPGSATDVYDDRGRLREISLEQDLGSCELERAGPARESVAFEPSGVVLRDLFGIT